MREPDAEPARTMREAWSSMGNVLRARAVLDASLQAHGLSGEQSPHELSIDYTGVMRYKGHYAIPGQVKEYALSGRYDYRLSDDAARHEGSMRTTAGDGRTPQTTLAIIQGGRDGRAVSRDYGAEELAEVSPAELDETRQELMWLLPHAILAEAGGRADSLRWLGQHMLGDAEQQVICYSDRAGVQWNLHIDAATALLTRVERLLAHDLEGDAMEWYQFDGYHMVSGLAIPTRRREERLEPWATWSREIAYGEVRVAPELPNDRFALPPVADPGRGKTHHDGRAGDANTATRVVELGQDLFLLEMPEEDCKVVFLALSDHVVVIEAPLSSRAGERIIRAVRATVPDRPIRYLAMSHHHPHYTGGLRPFVQTGVTLLTTPGNRDHIAAIARRPHRIAPDALARDWREPRIELVEGRRVLSDGEHELEIRDIGKLSKHTDEYLIFYFPRHKLLFEGDLGWLPEGTVDDFARQRARRLLDVIHAQNLDVERVVQSWPLRSQKSVATIADVEAWASDVNAPE